MSTADAFAAAVGEHDAVLRRRGVEIWVGSEPTFTDRGSNDPEWTTLALGEDKGRRAADLLREFCVRFPGGAAFRSIGRQYPGEDEPRWSLGLYRYRDGRVLWEGPEDPLLVAELISPGGIDLERWNESLAALLRRIGASVWTLKDQPENERRLVLCLGKCGRPDLADPRLRRPSIHSGVIPKTGLADELAAEGLWLFILSVQSVEGRNVAVVDLPYVADVPTFLSVLRAVGESARQSSLETLILRGFQPPVDRSVEWATITPDPAVIEINMAPDGTAAAFLDRTRAVYRSAGLHGLSPFRLYFNGTVVDSGGGGQITLGGPSPGSSPFFVEPRLLPRLIRYFNRHPGLSYLFSHDSIGSSGQSVRPDERGEDAFRELGLALALLDHNDGLTPEILWRSLAPFLTDPSGNSHRAELNIEKLWNPFVPGRGQLGLVEFRAFRMQHTPERAAALACLLRSVAAMLMDRDFNLRLIAWGPELHDRFALPYYLERDLAQVFDDLRDSDLELAEPLRAVLLQDEFRHLAEFDLGGYSVRLRRALEFWPLVGDSSQEQGTSRLVDSSTQRLELTVRHRSCKQEEPLSAVRVWAEGIELPMREEGEGSERAKVFGLRYRCFVPWQGLHPTLGASPTLRLTLNHNGVARQAVWHEWRPEGGGYPGLPSDLDAARERRRERLTLSMETSEQPMPGRTAPPESLTPWCLDLRWLSVAAPSQSEPTTGSRGD